MSFIKQNVQLNHYEITKLFEIVIAVIINIALSFKDTRFPSDSLKSSFLSRDYYLRQWSYLLIYQYSLHIWVTWNTMKFQFTYAAINVIKPEIGGIKARCILKAQRYLRSLRLLLEK